MAKKTTVQTVLGPLPTSELGATFSHEHVLVAPNGYESDSTLVFDHETQLLNAVSQMKELRSFGVSTIVDPIPMDLGRKAEFIADVSEASGMNIICATGLYFEGGPFAGYPTYYKLKTVDELEEIFVKELTNGIGPRKIMPGVIKCATSAFELTQNEKKALAAAGRAARATDTRITTHTQEGTMGPEQVEIFEQQGVPPRHVTVGHCSDSADLSYLVKVLKTGAYVGFDRVGIETWVDDEIKVGTLAALVAMGYEEQLVLSHDNVGCMHGRRPAGPPDPKRRFTLIHEEFIPAVKKAGISEASIQTMLVDNPRRFFEGE